MSKTLQTIIIFLFSLQLAESQDCNILSVDATSLNCAGDSFNILIDLEVDNPTSLGFVLAGNGTVYGTFLYQDLPIIVGPFLGDDLAVYEFIAWDVENPDCQNYTTVPAANCGPIPFVALPMQN